MDNRDCTVVIRCFDTCVYTLFYPAFFVNAPKATLRKIFKWLFQFDWYRENEETISFLDRELQLPVLKEAVEAQNKQKIEDAKTVWRERLAEYEEEYLNPDPATFPADWTKEKKRAERQNRKEQNARRMAYVKDAKTVYERAKKQAAKDLARVKEVFAIYQEAKNQ